MAVPSSTIPVVRKSYRRQALIWLMMTLLLGVATVLLWMFSQTPAVGTKIENAPIAAPEVLTSELEQPLSIEALHELDNDVQPIDFEDTIRDLRNYPDEFKDKSYLLANNGKWTVQVMNVAENEVIVSYLEGRKDRKKFAYFRYRDENNKLRYMLTYGLLSSPQEAVGASKLVDFGLPADVLVLAEEINRYVSIIDNYERPLPIQDLSSGRSRSVNLKPTKREVPVRRQAPVAGKTDSNAADSSSNDKAATDKDKKANESIRQSNDTSATLAVKEERTVSTDDAKDSGAKKDTSKPPAVATPKAPSSPNSSEKSNDSSSKKADKPAGKKEGDSIKELIDEKSN